MSGCDSMFRGVPPCHRLSKNLWNPIESRIYSNSWKIRFKLSVWIREIWHKGRFCQPSCMLLEPLGDQKPSPSCAVRFHNCLPKALSSSLTKHWECFLAEQLKGINMFATFVEHPSLAASADHDELLHATLRTKLNTTYPNI